MLDEKGGSIMVCSFSERVLLPYNIPPSTANGRHRIRPGACLPGSMTATLLWIHPVSRAYGAVFSRNERSLGRQGGARTAFVHGGLMEELERKYIVRVVGSANPRSHDLHQL